MFVDEAIVTTSPAVVLEKRVTRTVRGLDGPYGTENEGGKRLVKARYLCCGEGLHE